MCEGLPTVGRIGRIGRIGKFKMRDVALKFLHIFFYKRFFVFFKLAHIQSIPKSLRETSKTQPKWPKVALVQKILKNEFA